MMVDQITIRTPDDFHVHLRCGELLHRVIPHTVMDFARALVMPNTGPHKILTGKDAARYRGEIVEAVTPYRYGGGFTPLMTIYLTEETTPQVIKGARAAGVVAVKFYPRPAEKGGSGTTRSEDGVRIEKITHLSPVFETMEECGMVLCLHGEVPDDAIDGLQSEAAFLPILEGLAERFPHLRIVLEHVSSARGVECVERLPITVAATITAHHLVLTHNDVIGYSAWSGGLMRPHHYCRPIAKFLRDRVALRKAATSGNPKFFFGSDSAPHPHHAKEATGVCAGVFTAPVALSVLAQVFEEESAIDRLDAFASGFGACFYRLPFNEGTVTLKKSPWLVPDHFESVVPLYADQKLAWQVVSRE